MKVKIENLLSKEEVVITARSLSHGARIAAAWVDVNPYRVDTAEDAKLVATAAGHMAKVTRYEEPF